MFIHSKAHNFVQESPYERIKVPFYSAINVPSDGVLISASTNVVLMISKCLEVRQEVHTSVYLATIRVRVRAGSGYIVKYRLPDL